MCPKVSRYLLETPSLWGALRATLSRAIDHLETCQALRRAIGFLHHRWRWRGCNRLWWVWYQGDLPWGLERHARDWRRADQNRYLLHQPCWANDWRWLPRWGVRLSRWPRWRRLQSARIWGKVSIRKDASGRAIHGGLRAYSWSSRNDKNHPSDRWPDGIKTPLERGGLLLHRCL